MIEMKNINVLISDRGHGRIANVIREVLEHDGYIVEFTGDMFLKDTEDMIKRGKYSIFIAAAWNTKCQYKTDVENIRLAIRTRELLKMCKENGVMSIFLGTSMMSGFEDCLYHVAKDSCFMYADSVVLIPYVWQPNRVGSLAYKVEHGEPYMLQDKEVVYVTELDIAREVLNVVEKNRDIDMKHMNDWRYPFVCDLGGFVEKKPLSEWIKYFTGCKELHGKGV